MMLLDESDVAAARDPPAVLASWVREPRTALGLAPLFGFPPATLERMTAARCPHEALAASRPPAVGSNACRTETPPPKKAGPDRTHLNRFPRLYSHEGMSFTCEFGSRLQDGISSEPRLRAWSAFARLRPWGPRRLRGCGAPPPRILKTASPRQCGVWRGASLMGSMRRGVA